MKTSAFFLLLLVVLFPLRIFAQVWEPVNHPFNGSVSIWDDSNFVIFSGCLAITHDAGASWVVNPAPERMTSVHYVKGHLLGYGNRDEDAMHFIYRAQTFSSYDDGRSWTSFDGEEMNGSTHQIMDDWGDRFIVGNYPFDGFTYYGANVVHVWNDLPLPIEKGAAVVMTIDFDGDSLALTVVKQRKNELFRTTNRGKSWTLLPLEVTGTPDVGLYYRWTIHQVDGVWYLNNDLDFLRSTDAGSTWDTLIRAPKRIAGFSVLGSKIYLAFEDDYLLRSDDLGKSWYAEGCADGKTTKGSVRCINDSVTFAWGGGLSIRRGKAGNPKPVLHMIRQIYFGAVPPNAPVTQTHWVSNPGGAPLSITAIIPDTTTVTVTPTNVVIKPGDSAAFQITILTANPLGDHAVVNFYSNAEPARQTLDLDVRAAVPALSYSTKQLDFGDVLIGEKQVKRVGIKNLVDVTAVISKAPLTAGLRFHLVSSPDTVRRGIEQFVECEFEPLQSGPESDTLIISSNSLRPDTVILSGNGGASRSGEREIAWQIALSGMRPMALSALRNFPVTVYSSASRGDSSAVISSEFSDYGTEVRRRTLYSWIGEAAKKIRLDRTKDGEVLGAVQHGTETLVMSLNSDLTQRWIRKINFPKEWRNSYQTSSGSRLMFTSNNIGSSSFLLPSVEGGYSIGNTSTSRGFIWGSVTGPQGDSLSTITTLSGATYIQQYPYEVLRGPSYCDALISGAAHFYGSVTIDEGGGYIPEDVPSLGPSLYKLHSQIVEFGGGTGYPLFQEANSSGSGKLGYFDGKIYMAGKYFDTAWYLLAIDTLSNQLFRTWLPRSIFSVVDTVLVDANSIYVIGERTTSTAGRDVVTARFSKTGDLLWTKVFDGLASLDDLPIQSGLTDGNVTILIRSGKGRAQDAIILRYAQSGAESFRLRYDGVAGTLDDPIGFQAVDSRDLYLLDYSDSSTIPMLVRYRSTNASAPIIADMSEPYLRVTPNPSYSGSTLRIVDEQGIGKRILIMDALGRCIWEGDLLSGEVKLPASHFPAGSYTVTIVGEPTKGTKFVRE